jgi:hypothetical protein
VNLQILEVQATRVARNVTVKRNGSFNSPLCAGPDQDCSQWVQSVYRSSQ